MSLHPCSRYLLYSGFIGIYCLLLHTFSIPERRDRVYRYISNIHKHRFQYCLLVILQLPRSLAVALNCKIVGVLLLYNSLSITLRFEIIQR